MARRTTSRSVESRGVAPRRARLLAGLCILLIAVAAISYFASRTRSDATPGEAKPGHLYSETADANAQIAQAVAQAAREHKRVILDFGGDWCGDCQVLDFYFHQGPNAELLERNFVLTHVWIGQMDANLDVAAKYGVPVTEGVPALAVLSPTGETLYAQQTGEFKRMRTMDPASVTAFLNKWKS